MTASSVADAKTTPLQALTQNLVDIANEKRRAANALAESLGYAMVEQPADDHTRTINSLREAIAVADQAHEAAQLAGGYQVGIYVPPSD